MRPGPRQELASEPCEPTERGEPADRRRRSVGMWLLVLFVASLVLASCGGSAQRPAELRPTAERHARNGCSKQSEANFPGAFTNAGNVVVGPLVLIGATYTDRATVREFGGNKFPLLVRPRHTVTIAVAPKARRFARLAYGPLPSGKPKLRDAYTSETFIACRRSRARSRADGKKVTFWSGSVLSRRAACLPLDVTIDDAAARRIKLALGKRC
jgi:hypothetical protein